MQYLLVQLLQVHWLYSSFHYKGLTLRRHCFVLAVALLCWGTQKYLCSFSVFQRLALLKSSEALSKYLASYNNQKPKGKIVFLWLFVLRCAEYCWLPFLFLQLLSVSSASPP